MSESTLNNPYLFLARGQSFLESSHQCNLPILELLSILLYLFLELLNRLFLGLDALTQVDHLLLEIDSNEVELLDDLNVALEYSFEGVIQVLLVLLEIVLTGDGFIGSQGIQDFLAPSLQIAKPPLYPLRYFILELSQPLFSVLLHFLNHFIHQLFSLFLQNSLKIVAFSHIFFLIQINEFARQFYQGKRAIVESKSERNKTIDRLNPLIQFLLKYRLIVELLVEGEGVEVVGGEESFVCQYLIFLSGHDILDSDVHLLLIRQLNCEEFTIKRHVSQLFYLQPLHWTRNKIKIRHFFGYFTLKYFKNIFRIAFFANYYGQADRLFMYIMENIEGLFVLLKQILKFKAFL